eukprot:345171_1
MTTALKSTKDNDTQIPFPKIDALSELRGPINNTHNIFIRPPSAQISTIWYQFNNETNKWYWTPYNDHSVWMSVSNLLVSDGHWKNCKPAIVNVNIIEYLNQNNPIPPRTISEKK